MLLLAANNQRPCITQANKKVRCGPELFADAKELVKSIQRGKVNKKSEETGAVTSAIYYGNRLPRCPSLWNGDS